MGGGATPTPLTEEEIKEYIELYAQAAKNSIEAGFDGVEIHGANGYLIDQFTQDNANNRTDAYGGSVEKRARFGIEVAKAVVEAVGADKTGIRLSPFSTFQGMKMKDPKPQFSYLAQELKKLKLAYIHVVESRISGNADVETTEKIDFLLDIWNNQSPAWVLEDSSQILPRGLLMRSTRTRTSWLFLGDISSRTRIWCSDLRRELSLRRMIERSSTTRERRKGIPLGHLARSLRRRQQSCRFIDRFVRIDR